MAKTLPETKMLKQSVVNKLLDAISQHSTINGREHY